jgi:hypothetical protein
MQFKKASEGIILYPNAIETFLAQAGNGSKKGEIDGEKLGLSEGIKDGFPVGKTGR